MTNIPGNLRQFRVTPRPRYIANSHRIELDDASPCSIDYEFFDSKSKGVSIQKSKLILKKTLNKEKVLTLVAEENVSKIMQHITGDLAKEKNSTKFYSMSSGTSKEVEDVFDRGNNDKETQTPALALLEKNTSSRAVQTEKDEAPASNTRHKSVSQILTPQKTMDVLKSDKATSCISYTSQDKPVALDAGSPETRTETNLSDTGNTVVTTGVQNLKINKKTRNETNLSDTGNMAMTTGIQNLKMNEKNNSDVLSKSVCEEATVKKEHIPKINILNKVTDLSETSDLINCIAYTSDDDGEIRNLDVDLMSSPTTSEITTVTSCASSSEYSIAMQECKTNASKQRNSKQVQGQKPTVLVQEHPVGNLDSGEPQRLPTNSSPSFKSSSTCKMPPINMSFPRSKVLEIERENRCLLRKINGTRNSLRKPSLMTPNLNLSSTAINRRNKNNEIHWENQRFLRKLNSIKATRTSSSWKHFQKHD